MTLILPVNVFRSITVKLNNCGIEVRNVFCIELSDGATLHCLDTRAEIRIEFNSSAGEQISKCNNTPHTGVVVASSRNA